MFKPLLSEAVVMDNLKMSSEIILLISLVIGIELSMPIGTYLLFSGRHDDKTRLWLASVCFTSAGMILVALRPFMHPYFGHQLAWMLVVPAFLMMIEALRRETKPKSSWRFFGLLVLGWSLSVNILDFLGYTESWGIAVYRMTIFVLCTIMWIMVSRLRGAHPSKSLVLLQIGLLLYAVPPLLGIVIFILTSSADVMNVYKFSLVSNILVFGFMLAVMFISWGYWGFTLEKSERERNLAQVGEDKAVQDAERYRRLVDERDRLLVMNSRFSAVSALSSFSAMLIHDITQPLQTLQLGLERIRANLIKGASRDQLEHDVLRLESTMDRAGDLVTALRRLMQSGESRVVPVPVMPLFAKVDSILTSDALKREAVIRFKSEVAPDCCVYGDEVMLQRVIINLVSNALYQFRSHEVSSPLIDIRLFNENLSNEPNVVIEVTDNGGGFSAEVLERIGQPWTSEQTDSLGMALMLTKQLMGIWGGQLKIANRTDGVAGAIVRVELRMA